MYGVFNPILTNYNQVSLTSIEHHIAEKRGNYIKL